VIRQSARLKQIEGGDCLRVGDKGTVRFRFLFSPEYIREGWVFLMREGKTKVLGTVCKVLPEKDLT
jgi:elongation factor 1-alpha